MYDVAILGAGPAGVTAAIYCARYKMNTLLLSYNVGGWVNNAYIVENMPSRPSVGGADLVESYKEHIKNNDIDYKKETVTKIESEDCFLIKTNKGEYKAKYVIYALGTKKRMLNVPGEGKLLGKGVHTCATCDAPFYRDLTVTVVGGNDGGAKTALLLSEYAKKVYLYEIMDKLPMEPMWKDMLEKNEKVELVTGTSVKEILGEDKVTGVILTDDTQLDLEGVFIEIGSDPNVSVPKAAGVEIDEYNCINVDKTQMTNVDRFYAAGDVTNNSNYVRQIATAQAEGAVAANAIYRRVLQEKTE